ncbi:MAG: S8 family serine peptidase, partial [Thermoanaerobaculia bacterium]
MKKKYPDLWAAFCGFPGTSVAVGGIAGGIGVLLGFTGGIGIAIAAVAALVWGIECYIDTTNWKAAWAQYNSLMKSLSQQANSNDDGNAPQGFVRADGTGQTVGLLEFDTFDINDVNDYLAYIGESPTRIDNLSQVHVGGGAVAGADQDEVLLDIDTVMSIAPGAQVVVYDAPFNGQAASYAAVFNAMINDGVSIISNSWASCEDQMSLADVQGIDSVLQTAAAAGIGVFNGAGDSGSTCLDGAPNTITVPADSPNATAVGGTTLIQGPAFTYAAETWWNGSSANPPTGQGGFGVSRFFARPAYQNALNVSPMRSIPDVAIDADPATGMVICQASDGGCPTGSLYGGTSLAAPEFAAYAALLNDANTRNLGAVNPQFYPFANQDAFHSASSMGSDFAHVGLGSPNVNVLRRMLAGESAGVPDAALSVVNPLAPAASLFTATADPNNANVAADGVTPGGVLVLLVDAEGNSVSGKTVTLATNPGSHAVITPASGVSNVSNGAVVFTVTDLTPEPLTFTATDVTDGIVLQATAGVAFVTPPAASAGISAFPTTVTADGISTTTITVFLEDGLGRPTPGKEITINQGDTRSIVVGPVPPVTDASGQIQFTATDQVNEVVTFTAVDVTDGDLAVPGSAVVTFTNSTGAS